MGHIARDVRDVGLNTASDSQIAQHARGENLTIITADFDFADVRIYPPENYSGIVVIDRPPSATVSQILDMVQQLLDQTDLQSELPGRLAIVSPKRVRLRPALPDKQ
jgi:predicted nuclease of predicted toxin-antitoxin system